MTEAIRETPWDTILAIGFTEARRPKAAPTFRQSREDYVSRDGWTNPFDSNAWTLLPFEVFHIWGWTLLTS